MNKKGINAPPPPTSRTIPLNLYPILPTSLGSFKVNIFCLLPIKKRVKMLMPKIVVCGVNYEKCKQSMK